MSRRNTVRVLGLSAVSIVVLIVVMAVALIVIDIRRGMAGSLDLGFTSISSGRFLDRDILGSLCSFPYDRACVFSVSSSGDTVVIADLDPGERVWWSVSSLTLSTYAQLRSGVPDQDEPTMYYVSNSPIGTIDWAILRGYGPDQYEVTTVCVDSLVAKEADRAGEMIFRFRTRSISFLDKDGRVVGAWRHKRVVEGKATISSRSNRMSMTLELGKEP
jgi:hypothetical protein